MSKEQEKNPTLYISAWTDGACSGNPGPGGWAYVYVYYSSTGQKITVQDSGQELMTTNNRMELTAVIRLLRDLQKVLSILRSQDKQRPILHCTLTTDSLGVINWNNGLWKRKDPIIRELCERIDALREDIDLHFKWVKGHSGHEMNELVDKLATMQAKGVI